MIHPTFDCIIQNPRVSHMEGVLVHPTHPVCMVACTGEAKMREQNLHDSFTWVQAFWTSSIPLLHYPLSGHKEESGNKASITLIYSSSHVCMGFMHLGLDETLLKKRQWWLNSLLFSVLCSVTFRTTFLQLSQMPVHLWFAIKCGVSFSGSLSCQFPHWKALMCCNLMSFSVALSTINPVCAEGHSSATICMASLSAVVSAAKCSHWRVLISSIGSLNRASARSQFSVAVLY